MMGVLLHVLCDAANNLGVIAAALVIWLAKYEGRYYADPGVSMGIAIMIIISSIPLGKSDTFLGLLCPCSYTFLTDPHLVRTTGLILLESAPNGVNLMDVQHDLETVSIVQVTASFLSPNLTVIRFRACTLSTNYTFGDSTSAKPSHPSTLWYLIPRYPVS
jgi:Co/Zn/Cd efflux system component